MSEKRILIVEDSISYQRLLSRIIDSHPMLKVVGTAENGQVALQMIEQLKPDLVSLDVQMPIMDGLETLRELRIHWPELPSMMVSSLTGVGADEALDALALGARDCIAKPSLSGDWEANLGVFTQDLQSKILALCGGDYMSLQNPQSQAPLPSKIRTIDALVKRSSKQSVTAKIHVLAIGISTGGPDALARLLPQLPADLPIPVVIVQHMPSEFTQKLACRLNDLSAIKVKEGEHGDVLSAGTVYIAPGDYHMALECHGSHVAISLDKDPPENSCRPSVNKLFRSVSTVYGSDSLAVIMTGMGQDGLLGAELLSSAGAQILAQDEASSVVWGMPGFVVRAGLADEVLPLDKMAAAIQTRVTNSYIPHSNFLPGKSKTAKTLQTDGVRSRNLS